MQAEVNDIIAELNLYQKEMCQRLGHTPKARNDQIEEMLSNFLVASDRQHINIEAVMALRHEGLQVDVRRSVLSGGVSNHQVAAIYGCVGHGNTTFSFSSAVVAA